MFSRKSNKTKKFQIVGASITAIDKGKKREERELCKNIPRKFGKESIYLCKVHADIYYLCGIYYKSIIICITALYLTHAHIVN